MSNFTAADVSDQTGKTVFITGANTGLGFEAAKVLAGKGARVLIGCRSKEKAGIARKAILADHPKADIAVVELDLANLASVTRAAAVVAKEPQLDILINNAGIMACPEARVGPGWESQFGINHLGHMAMSQGLMAAMQRADSPRLVALSSTAHIRSDVHWDDPHFNNHPYEKWDAYGQAKSANALFALGLDNQHAETGIRAFSVHPGGIFTPLQRHLPDEEMVALGWKNADGTTPPAIQAMFKTPEQGASTSVWAATSPKLAGMGGVYCEDCDIAKMATEDSQRWEHAREWITDDEKADRLWTLSEQMLAGETV